METYHRPVTIRPARLGHALHKEGCLFCRRHDGGFDSEEHVFAYALGNRDYVLPPGVVCDRCNNGPLQTADKALSSFPPIEMLRAERGLRTRKTKGLVMKMNGSEVWWESPGELRVRTAKPGVVTRTGPSSGKLQLSAGRPSRERLFRRITYAVWKSALEDLYRQNGPEVGFDPKFDRVREAVIGTRPSRGWCYCPKESKPHNGVALHLLPCLLEGVERLLVCLDVFGVAFVTDLIALDLDRDEIKPPTPSNVWILGER
jgi:hypothetical protein